MKVKPKNIQSVPVRHGKYNSTYGHTINKFPEYLPDDNPGNRKKLKKERSDYYGLVKKRGGPFKSMAHPRAVINPDHKLYGLAPEY